MSKSSWKRVGWLIIIWISSVSALALVAFFFRFLMTSAGFRT